MRTYPDIQLFTGGQWCHDAEGKCLPIIDPATEVEPYLETRFVTALV